MKARVIATGDIVDVEWYGHDSMGTIYADVTHTTKYYEYELDFDTVYDYWDRFEHQAAIAAMQGMLNNSLLITSLLKVNKSHEDIVVEVTNTAIRCAHALVEKYKKEEK